MGTPKSSSRKRKASSSMKKNTCRDLYKTGRKKRFKGNKSKKSRRRSISISYSDGDDSTCSMSCSCSSCERGSKQTRARRKKSRNRKKALTSSDSDGRSTGFFHDRKRKRSKRKDIGDAGKKTSKKKSKRDDNASSVSSDTFSCSACRSGRNSGESDSKTEICRGQNNFNKRKQINENESECGYVREGYRSASCSLCSKVNDPADDRYEEAMVVENNSVRLKSIVVVPENLTSEEIRSFEKGNEEITYDHDDYPCRSGDSNDDGSRKYPVPYLSERRTVVENVSIETTKERNESGNNHEGNSLSHDAGISTASRSPGVDLELILRQKALENLKKFRGSIPVNAKISRINKMDNKINYEKLPAEENARDLGELQVASGVHGSTHSAAIATIPNPKVRILKSFSSKLDVLNQVEASKDSKQMKVTCAATTDASDRNALSLIVPKSSPQSFPVEQLVRETSVPTNTNVSNSSNSSVRGANAVNASVFVPVSGNNPIKEVSDMNQPQKQVGEGSQFETKTMSVMRGGEMVQVSYKVYIPKKAPALSRRRLQR